MPRFKKGQSGNARGRPRGIADKRAEFRKRLEPYAEELIQKAVSLALEGDVSALRMCLDRIIPPLKDTPVTGVELGGDGLTQRAEKIFDAVNRGEITPSQGDDLMRALGALVKVKEADDFERRLSELEKRNSK